MSKVPWSKTWYRLRCTSARKHSLSPSLFSHHHHLIWQSLPSLSSSTQNYSTETQKADKPSSFGGCKHHNKVALASDSVRCSSKVRKPGPTKLYPQSLFVCQVERGCLPFGSSRVSSLFSLLKGLSESAATEKEGTGWGYTQAPNTFEANEGQMYLVITCHLSISGLGFGVTPEPQRLHPWLHMHSVPAITKAG